MMLCAALSLVSAKGVTKFAVLSHWSALVMFHLTHQLFPTSVCQLGESMDDHWLWLEDSVMCAGNVTFSTNEPHFVGSSGTKVT